MVQAILDLVAYIPQRDLLPQQVSQIEHGLLGCRRTETLGKILPDIFQFGFHDPSVSLHNCRR